MLKPFHDRTVHVRRHRRRNASRKNKNISRYGQGMFLQKTAVFIKFQMKVACVLYLHFSIYQYRCYLTEYDRKSRFYPIYKQAPYYAETCCKIRINK